MKSARSASVGGAPLRFGRSWGWTYAGSPRSPKARGTRGLDAPADPRDPSRAPGAIHVPGSRPGGRSPIASGCAKQSGESGRRLRAARGWGPVAWGRRFVKKQDGIKCPPDCTVFGSITALVCKARRQRAPGAAPAWAVRNGGLGGPGGGPTEALPTPKPWGLEASAEPRVPSRRPSPYPVLTPSPSWAPRRQAVRKLGAAFLPRLGFRTCRPWPETWGVGLP